MADSETNPLAPTPSEEPAGPPQIKDLFPNNPGTFDELHKKCLEVFPQAFDGGKFALNKGLSDHLQVSHVVTLAGNPQIPSGYKFGVTNVNVTPTGELNYVLMGDISPGGDLSANMIYQACPQLKTKFMGQMEDQKFQATQLSAEYMSENATSSVTFANVDLFNPSGVGIFHYLHKVSSRWSLGAEMITQFGSQVPGNMAAMVGVSARYEGGGGGTATCSAGGSSGLRLMYHQQCSKNLQLAAEFEAGSRVSPEATASVGYELQVPKSSAVFRGKLDSSGVITMMMEKKLDPLPFTLALCASHNTSSNKFKAGIGFYIGN